MGLFVRLGTRVEKGIPYYTAASKNEVRKLETLSETLYSSIEITLIPKAKAKTTFPILKTSAKAVQTTRVVYTDYG